MTTRRWYENNALFLLICLLLPPLGLILLWLRPGGAVRKVVGSLAIAFVAAAHLFAFWGLRMEVDGTGIRPIFTFRNPTSYYEAAEVSRPVERSAVVEAASVAPSLESSNYWTDYRGPERDGHYTQTPIRTNWPAEGLPELWRREIGGGYASVVIADGRVFTIEQRRNDEVVAAYNFETGQELWTHGWPGHFQESMGGPGPRTTPTWHEGKVYALGAEGELVCLDAATGKLIWGKNILSDNGAGNLTWAVSGSPLIVDEKLIVLPGGKGERSVAAYHKATGEPVWKALDDQQSYTSPMLVELAGRRQIIFISARRLMGVTVEDGSLLWDYPWVTSYDVNAAQPIVVDTNHVFVSSGYGHGAALVKVTSQGAKMKAEEVWQNNTMKNKFNSSVLYEGHVYGLDEGILACVDVWSGERTWKGGRYGFGQLLLAGGHLIVLTERGEVVLVKATPEAHQELASFSAISGKTWNNPAIADGRLIVRNQTEMACYDLRPR